MICRELRGPADGPCGRIVLALARCGAARARLRRLQPRLINLTILGTGTVPAWIRPLRVGECRGTVLGVSIGVEVPGPVRHEDRVRGDERSGGRLVFAGAGGGQAPRAAGCAA